MFDEIMFYAMKIAPIYFALMIVINFTCFFYFYKRYQSCSSVVGVSSTYLETCSALGLQCYNNKTKIELLKIVARQRVKILELQNRSEPRGYEVNKIINIILDLVEEKLGLIFCITAIIVVISLIKFPMFTLSVLSVVLGLFLLIRALYCKSEEHPSIKPFLAIVSALAFTLPVCVIIVRCKSALHQLERDEMIYRTDGNSINFRMLTEIISDLGLTHQKENGDILLSLDGNYLRAFTGDGIHTEFESDKGDPTEILNILAAQFDTNFIEDKGY